MPSANAKTSAKITNRAFTHGAAAAGVRHVREGFAWTAEDDLAFALGWPYLRRLVAGHPDEAESDPEVRAKAIVSGPYGVDLPEDFARRRVRALAVWKMVVGGGRAPAVDEALANDAPLEADEARAIIRAQVTATTYVVAGLQEEIVFGLEALVGPDVVLDEVLASLEAVEPKALLDVHHVRASYAKYVGFGLLRVPSAVHDAAAARARRLLDGASAAGAVTMGSAAHWLDLALDGGAALERTARPFAEFALHANEAPAIVSKTVLAEPVDATFRPRARLAFLGDGAVFDHYLKNLKKVKQVDDLRFTARDFVRMRSDEALAIVLELSATSKAKKDALAFLIEHAAHVRSFLERTAAGGGDQAGYAKTALSKLPKA